MEKVLEFATNYYLVFTIISAVLILALIGYKVENKAGKDIHVKVKKEKKKKVKAKKGQVENPAPQQAPQPIQETTPQQK